MMMELAERESGREEDLEELSKRRRLISLFDELVLHVRHFIYLFFRRKIFKDRLKQK